MYLFCVCCVFFVEGEGGIRDSPESGGVGDV